MPGTSAVSTSSAPSSAVMPTSTASGSAYARLVQSARGIRPLEEDEKLREAIFQLSVSTLADNGAFDRSLDAVEGIMMRMPTGMLSSTTKTTGGRETGGGEFHSEKKPLLKYAEDMWRTSALFAADLAKRVGQTMEPLGLGLQAQCSGNFVALPRSISEGIKDEPVGELLDDLVYVEAHQLQAFLRMGHVVTGAKRDQGCMPRKKKSSGSKGQEQNRMADSGRCFDTIGTPIGPKAAAEVAPSGREEAAKVEEIEEASQQVRKAPPMICLSALRD